MWIVISVLAGEYAVPEADSWLLLWCT